MAPFLHVVYQPTSSRPAVDLVFVHGLNPVNVHNHAYHTWTHPNGVCWPKDLLPKTAPQSRVFVFGYNSNGAFNVSTAGLRNHADALLHLLLDARGADTHPIIFVCHSLGGLVVKQALVRASLNRQTYGILKDCTHSIAFFGTPHKGSHGVSFGKIIAGIISTFAGEEKNTLLGALAKDSSLLTELKHNFSSQLEDYQFISFFETKAMRKPGALTGLIKMVVVSVESSTLGLSPQRERQIGLDSNHSDICKLAAADDRYRIVVSAIQSLVNQALMAPKPGHGTAAQSVPPATESSQMEPVPLRHVLQLLQLHRLVFPSKTFCCTRASVAGLSPLVIRTHTIPPPRL